MRTRFLISGAMAALGTVMLLAAVLAAPASSGSSGPSASGQKKGGTMNINMSATDVDYIDPALAYGTNSWQVLDAACAKLVNYPDKPGVAGTKLVPDAAVGFPSVSKDGKTYTFTIRSGWRSNTGQTLTAANFAAAFNRDLNPKMQSPAVPFITGASGILGAQAVADGKAATASGVKASGQKLTITLQKPDGSFLSKMAMDFFCAIPTNTPISADGINTFPSYGPYYVASRQVGRQIIVRANPNYKGPRPHNINTFVSTVNTNLDQSLLQVKAGQADYDAGGLPPTAHAGLAQQYGINKGRFFLRKQMTMWYLAMNHEQPLFGPKGSPNGNVPLLKALNTAIDRPALVRQFGYLAGARTDQVIPYTMPGFRNWDIYSIRGANPTKAAAIAKGNTRSGHAVFYTFNSTPGPAISQVVQQNLKAIGVDVEIKTFDRVVQNQKEATRGEPFDITFEGWGADYADPVSFFNTLLWGGNIQQANNSNVSYFNSPTYNARILKVAQTAGAKRFSDYANLDRDIMKNASPFAPFINTNARIYVGPDVGCYKYAPAHGVTNLAAVCKK